MDCTTKVFERVCGQLATSEKLLITNITVVSDTTVNWLVNRLDVPLKILFIAFSFAASNADKRSFLCFLSVSIDDVTLESLFEDYDAARWTLDVDSDL